MQTKFTRAISAAYKIDIWIVGLFLAAVTLRCINYVGRSSMWLDELASAFNISERTFSQLATETLDFNQVAPLGFLWLQKLATLVFGLNDHAFRFFPFILSLLALVLFYALSKAFLKGVPLLGGFALFGLSLCMLFYSGEAKQYSGDVAAALFLVGSGLELLKGRLRPSLLWTISAGGFLLIFCSMPAVAIAPLVLLVVLVQLLKKKNDLSYQQFFTVALSWAIACILLTAYAKFTISNDVQRAMSDYWAGGFAPLTSAGDFLRWIPQRIQRELTFLLVDFLAFVIPQTGYMAWALMLLSVPGFIYLFRRNKAATAILFAPLVTALLLAIFRVLPFDSRVAIYATWPLIVSGMAGIAALSHWLPKMFSPAVTIIIVLVIALPIGVLMLTIAPVRPPFNAQSAQPVLRKLKKQMQPGDIIYVYFKARYAMRFYGPKEGITNYVTGRGHTRIEPFLRDIDSLRGNKRVWFFFSQWTPKQPFPDSIKAYMGTVIGKQIGVIPDPDGNPGEFEAAAHLYDLSGAK